MTGQQRMAVRAVETEFYDAVTDTFRVAPFGLVKAADLALEAWRASAAVPLSQISQTMGDATLFAAARQAAVDRNEASREKGEE